MGELYILCELGLNKPVKAIVNRIAWYCLSDGRIDLCWNTSLEVDVLL